MESHNLRLGEPADHAAAKEILQGFRDIDRANANGGKN
jgi:hypothetical protein